MILSLLPKHKHYPYFCNQICFAAFELYTTGVIGYVVWCVPSFLQYCAYESHQVAVCHRDSLMSLQNGTSSLHCQFWAPMKGAIGNIPRRLWCTVIHSCWGSAT